MQWTNDAKSYGWLTIALHWIAALGIGLMLVVGLRADFLKEASDRAGFLEAIGWHISIGATLIAFLAAQVIQYYAQKQPAPPEQPRPLQLLALTTHHLLLLAIALLIVSGPMLVWSNGRVISVWGWFAIPSPFAARNHDVHEIAETVHAIGRYMLYGLIPLHVLGVLKHLIIDRDGVMARMLAPKRG